MRPITLLLLLRAVTAGAELPADVLQLARVKAKVKQSLETLPDYTCLCTTERYRKVPGDSSPRLADRIRLEVVYAGKQELFAWPGESSFRTDAPAGMIGSGMFATGEFISHARGVFLNNTAVIRYFGETGMLGRRFLRWDFKISPFLNDWTVGFGSAKANAGAIGSFWVQPDTLDPEFLEIRTDGLPPDFPVQEVSTVIAYARTRIGTREVLLPQTAVTKMTELSGRAGVNETHFSHCRQYLVETVIRFNPLSAAPDQTAAPPGLPPETETWLPANLKIRVALNTPLESGTAAIGQAIEASVIEDVRNGKALIVPRGALLTGRVRRVEPNPRPAPHFIIALEFTDLAFDGERARFFAGLSRIAARTDLEIQTTPHPDGPDAAAQRFSYRVKELPGVGTFTLQGESFRIEKGLEMTWVTQDPRR